MADIFSPANYPLHFPEAQELHSRLVDSFPTNDEAFDIGMRSGLRRAQIPYRDTVYYQWLEILKLASSKELLRELVVTVKQFLHPGHSLATFIDGLLSGQPVISQNLPKAADGSPIFIEKNDAIFTEEALLYQDDLTMQVGLIPAFITTLTKLQRLVPSVCKLVVNFPGARGNGTGFLIDKDLVLTNYHVIVTKEGIAAMAITAQFDYDDDGLRPPPNPVPFDTLVPPVAASKENDWAILRLAQPVEASRPHMKLSQAIKPSIGDLAYIIQHPLGNGKRLGFVRNMVADVTDKVVHYLTDTQEGSSGAPVLNANGELIALHHAGGRPQQITGLRPVKKNEGIRISVILDKLKELNITTS